MLNDDFKEMLSALSEEGVKFLLIGAYALAAHGVPRATGDLDIWISPEGENAKRVYRALAAFGAPLHSIQPEDLAKEDVVLQLGVVPFRIDLLTTIDGVEFRDAWLNRDTILMDGLKIPLLSRVDLIRNKSATGRTQDLADLEALENGDTES